LTKTIRHGSIAIIVFLFISMLHWIGFFQSLDNISYDLRLKWSSAQPPDPAIAIIAIDDSSINELGRWPWSREVHANLLETLAASPPRVTVFDVLFSEASENPEQDKRLAKAMEELPGVVLAEYAKFSNHSENQQIQTENIVQPIPAFQSFAQGHINVIPDNDGSLRKALHHFSYQGTIIPSIDQVAVESYTGFPLDNASIPLDPLNRWLIPYLKASSYPIYSYVDVLKGRVPADQLKDRLVIIGPTAVGLFDHYPTPVASAMDGVEAHAHIMDALLHDRFITPLGWEWVWILLFILIGQFFASRFPLKYGISLALFAAAGYAFIALYLLEYQYLVLTVAAPLFALLLSFASQIGYHYYVERKERQQVTRLFGRFVAPQVVEEILRVGEENIKLGGVKRNISILFLDIRGFTPLSEKLSPEEVVDVLNSFFSEITRAIFENGGTLDKFIGDAVMAIFNAPLPVENHELQAVKAAMQIQQSALTIQKEIEKKYGRTVAFGIGIHCGDAVVGNIGAMQRLDYTAIGDNVNLAARLESNAKPNQIMISQQVFEKVSGTDDKISMASLGKITVKGKSQPIDVFEVHY